MISSPFKQVHSWIELDLFLCSFYIYLITGINIARIFLVSWQYYKVMFNTTQQQINGSLYQPQKLHHYCTEFPEQHRGSSVNLGDMENACIKKDKMLVIPEHDGALP